MRAHTKVCILVVLAMVSMINQGAWSAPANWKTEGWTRTDFSKSTIEWNEIMSGGPPRDGIPPIDAPLFRTTDAETSLADTDPVIALEINGDARAYPLRVLIWHEIANDDVGGIPVAVTYCPLCNAAIVFDRRVDKRTLSFGTTGKLRKSDLVMYDRQTESWWQQFSGEAIVGSLTGQVLQIVPSRLESFQSFRSRHPTGRVLYPADPAFRAYGRNPYEGYDTSAVPFLYRGELPTGINPMVRVVVVRHAGAVHAVTLELLREHGRLELDDFVMTWRSGKASALDSAEIAKGRDVGNVVVQKVDGGVGADVPYDLTFAFVAHAFHREAVIIQDCEARGTVSLRCGSIVAQ